jgi:hypothetical protein
LSRKGDPTAGRNSDIEKRIGRRCEIEVGDRNGFYLPDNDVFQAQVGATDEATVSSRRNLARWPRDAGGHAEAGGGSAEVALEATLTSRPSLAAQSG